MSKQVKLFVFIGIVGLLEYRYIVRTAFVKISIFICIVYDNVKKLIVN